MPRPTENAPTASLTRRAALTAGASLLVPPVLIPPARAEDPKLPPPLIIGVLTDQTGLGAGRSGSPLVQAVRMAVQDTGPLPDRRPVSVVTESFQLKADDALAIARRWCDQGVSVIVDVPGTNPALAVQAFVRARGRSDMITGSVGAELTGRSCSPLGTTWTVDTATTTAALVKAMARAGKKTWFLVVPDSVLGLAVQDDAVHAIEDAGGQIVGHSRHPLEVGDYTSIILQAKNSGAQAIGLCDSGQELVGQLRQFQDHALFDEGRSVLAFLPAVTDLQAAAGAAKGLLLASPFYWSQNDQARLFANRFLAATGQMPDAAHAGAYVAMRHYLRSVISTQGLDAELINQDMRRTQVYFFGRSARLRIDGRLAADLYLLRVKLAEAMRGDWDFYEQISLIPATEAYRQLNQTGCKLGL